MLIVDDAPRWRKQLTEILEVHGYYAASASTTQEALQLLHESLFHILILDIRMEEGDDVNEDGLKLLGELYERGLTNAINVIMISAHDTKENVRKAFRNYQVADFISKDAFNDNVLIKTLNGVLERDARINLGLKIFWQGVSSAADAIINLEVAHRVRVKPNTPLQNQIASELEDLLCRLFYEASSILVRPMTSGWSGTGVLWVQPFYTNGSGGPVIVKFGGAQPIAKEHYNFKKHVYPFIRGGRSTAIHDLRRTLSLGGIVYSLLGSSNDQLEDFSNFYGRATITQISDMLHRLFLETCSTWYANSGSIQPYDLSANYQQLLGFTWERLEQVLAEELTSVQGKHTLQFKSLQNERTFINPLQITAARQSQVFPTYICNTHGDFNQHNLLVDNLGYTWIIDFQRTGQSHILRDVAMLDSSIRFQLLKDTDADLEDRLLMEDALCSIERFSDLHQLAGNLATNNVAIAKAHTVVIHLRKLAHKLIEKNPQAHIREYYMALFYHALNTTRYTTLSLVQREHALLSASLLSERLGF